MKKKQRNSPGFKIRRNFSVGELDAETDGPTLRECFVESSDYESLLDCSSAKSIVLGRTGAGKSAALSQIAHSKQEGVILLDPNDFSFQYIENSNIIQLVEAAGVNLDIFYRLLWKHVLTVELLKKRYNIKDIDSQKVAFRKIEALVTFDKGKQKSLEYIKEWGDKFWEETEVRVKELTRRIEDELGSTLTVGAPLLKLSGNSGTSITEEERTEIRQRAIRVVDAIQFKKLRELVSLLANHVFDDEQRKFYLLIDKLDENWASTNTRCRLIRALIEEIKAFREVHNVKIIVALRRDLLAQVFDQTRDGGFQEEKYEGFILPLRWSEDELLRLIEKRINHLFKRQYSSTHIGFDDIFPVSKTGESAKAFILSRTLRRPRDVIQFVNECFKLVDEGACHLNWRILRAADANYSNKRLNSLYEEWGSLYPALKITLTLLNGRTATFSRSELKDERLDNVIMSLADTTPGDPCSAIAKKYCDSSITEADVLARLLQVMYQVGAIGVKTSATSTFMWAYIDQPTIAEGEIRRSISLRVHKMLWRALDIIPDDITKYELEDSDSNEDEEDD